MLSEIFRAIRRYRDLEKIPKYKDTIYNLERIIERNNKSIKEMREIVESARALTATLEKRKACGKVKCCTEEEAKEFAKKVGTETGFSYVPYKCDKCPHNKRTNQAWWHITHKFEVFRGLKYDR